MACGSVLRLGAHDPKVPSSSRAASVPSLQPAAQTLIAASWLRKGFSSREASPSAGSDLVSTGCGTTSPWANAEVQAARASSAAAKGARERGDSFISVAPPRFARPATHETGLDFDGRLSALSRRAHTLTPALSRKREREWLPRPRRGRGLG